VLSIRRSLIFKVFVGCRIKRHSIVRSQARDPNDGLLGIQIDKQQSAFIGRRQIKMGCTASKEAAPAITAVKTTNQGMQDAFCIG